MVDAFKAAGVPYVGLIDSIIAFRAILLNLYVYQREREIERERERARDREREREREREDITQTVGESNVVV
jgi:hypothetical protein